MSKLNADVSAIVTAEFLNTIEQELKDLLEAQSDLPKRITVIKALLKEMKEIDPEAEWYFSQDELHMAQITFSTDKVNQSDWIKRRLDSVRPDLDVTLAIVIAAKFNHQSREGVTPH